MCHMKSNVLIIILYIDTLTFGIISMCCWVSVGVTLNCVLCVGLHDENNIRQLYDFFYQLEKLKVRSCSVTSPLLC